MNHPRHESLSVELFDLSPDLLGRLTDGYLHLYTESVIEELNQAKTYEQFEDAVEGSLIVELDADEIYSLFRLLAEYYEGITDDLPETFSIH